MKALFVAGQRENLTKVPRCIIEYVPFDLSYSILRDFVRPSYKK